MSFAVMLAILYLMHLVLKINWYATGILAAYFAAAVYFHRKMAARKNLQEKRFYEAAAYMEAVLYAFSREGKIETALADVSASLPDGNMRKSVESALEHIHMTFDESDVAADALKIIGQEYNCGRLRVIHDFMLRVESHGGGIERQTGLLLEDKNRWEMRVKKAMHERQKMYRDVVMSIAASLVICGMTLYLPVMNMDISGNLLVQGLTVFVILLDDVILFGAQRYLAQDWLTIDLPDEEDDEKKMQEYKQYDPRKEKRLSIVLSVAAGAFTAVCFALGKEWLAAFAAFLFLICLNQHKIGHFLQRKRLTKSIKSAFPNWLMELALLLQSENVQVALDQSREHVPAVLSGELEDMTERLAISPEEAWPYHEFLKDFALPEVSAAMSLLYSLSVGNSSDADRQLAKLIEKNHEMLDTAETERMKEKNSGLYLLFLAPVLTGSLKLVVDMAVFMLSFLSASAL